MVIVHNLRNHLTLFLSHQSLTMCKDGGYREYSLFSTVFKKNRRPVTFAGCFTWTHRLLFFGNYPSLNTAFMWCHQIKKPKFNYVRVLFKQSNFWSKMLEMHFRRARFQNFSRGMPPDPLATRAFFVNRLLQSFCHLCITLLKPLIQ